MIGVVVRLTDTLGLILVYACQRLRAEHVTLGAASLGRGVPHDGAPVTPGVTQAVAPTAPRVRQPLTRYAARYVPAIPSQSYKQEICDVNVDKNKQ